MADDHAPPMAINLPDDQRAGVYSDVVLVWHNRFGFTLDFLTQIQPDPAQQPDGTVVMPAQVVARVRIPPAVIFPLIKTLNENLTRFEERFGAIVEPGAPEIPEQDGG